MSMKKPRILLWDLETGGVNALRANLGMVLNFGYKWLGEKDVRVLRVDQFPGWFARGRGVNDKGILVAALDVMNKADLLVAHYGDKFDRRFFQGRCAVHGLTPPPPVKQRDTWRIAVRAFNFSSNRLGALATTLGLSEHKHQKTAHEWPGWWIRAMAGDASALRDMAKYCAQDVRTLEQIYLRIRQYDYNHPKLFLEPGRCGICGGAVRYDGLIYVGRHAYPKYVCRVCGTWDRDQKQVKAA